MAGLKVVGPVIYVVAYKHLRAGQIDIANVLAVICLKVVNEARHVLWVVHFALLLRLNDQAFDFGGLGLL